MATKEMLPVVNDEGIDKELNELCEQEQQKLKQIEYLCPYCGWSYEPEKGCFCFRLVGWNDLT